MKIGIYMHARFAPTKGGGFSYQDRLLRRLFRHPRMQASLVLINDGLSGGSAEPEGFVDFGARDTVTLRQEEVGLPRRPLLRLRGRQRRWREECRRRREEYVLQRMREKEIGLIFYPEQHFLLTEAIPYVINNWDLAHVTAGFFPDVTVNFAARQRFYAETMHKAIGVCVESEAGRRELVRHAGIWEDKIRIVPMFPSELVDDDPGPEADRQLLEKYALNSRGYFFYPANFWRLKNHYAVLQAFARMESQERELVLVGADKGNLDYVLQTAQSLGVERRLKYLGFLQNAELNTLYRHAIALVMPTYLGPTNMPIIEAMALKCPVICSPMAGHVECGQETLSYVRPTDIAGLSAVMAEHARDPEKASENAERAYQHWRGSAFTIEHASEAMVSALEEFLAVRKTWGL